MNYTILIADDEPEIRTLLRLYLENENYQIIEAENGKQALELLKKEHVDLCLLDIMMPEMDGYHVLQELRKTSNIPVMILSANASCKFFSVCVPAYLLSAIYFTSVFFTTFSKSDAGCLHKGHIKSSGSSSPTYSYPQILQRHIV